MANPWLAVLKDRQVGTSGTFDSSSTAHFHKISSEEFRRQGLKRLTVAAAGLPVALDELVAFFGDDLQDFGSGAVSPAGIRKACEWYASQGNRGSW